MISLQQVHLSKEKEEGERSRNEVEEIRERLNIQTEQAKKTKKDLVDQAKDEPVKSKTLRWNPWNKTWSR